MRIELHKNIAIYGRLPFHFSLHIVLFGIKIGQFRLKVIFLQHCRIIMFLNINIFGMKKIMMTMAAMFVAVCASAQVYIGGSAALGGQKHGAGDI